MKTKQLNIQSPNRLDCESKTGITLPGLSRLALLAIVIGGFSACGTYEEPVQQNRWGYGSTQFEGPAGPQPPVGPPIDSTPQTDVTQQPITSIPAPVTPPPPPVNESVPWGIPIEGKPGYIRSPFSPTAGQIDVRGFPPGTEVKDPYNPGKLIMVP